MEMWQYQGLAVPAICITYYLFSLYVSNKEITQSDSCECFIGGVLINMAVAFVALGKLWVSINISSRLFFPVVDTTMPFLLVILVIIFSILATHDIRKKVSIFPQYTQNSMIWSLGEKISFSIYTLILLGVTYRVVDILGSL